MKVKEMLKILEKCNPEFEIFFGYETENIFDAFGVVKVIELKEFDNSESINVDNGVYVRCM